MAIVLIVLAIGSVAAGWIGIPHAIGGGNQIEAFLEPSFRAPGEAADVPEAAHGGAGTEIALMIVSTLVAFAGSASRRCSSCAGPSGPIVWLPACPASTGSCSTRLRGRNL